MCGDGLWRSPLPSPRLKIVRVPSLAWKFRMGSLHAPLGFNLTYHVVYWTAKAPSQGTASFIRQILHSPAGKDLTSPQPFASPCQGCRQFQKRSRLEFWNLSSLFSCHAVPFGVRRGAVSPGAHPRHCSYSHHISDRLEVL
jgi:hypothetical protein